MKRVRTTALPGGEDGPVLGQGTWRITASQVALAWVIGEDGVIAMPKSANPAHVRENRGAADLRLTERDLEELDESFPAPSEPVPLETR